VHSSQVDENGLVYVGTARTQAFSDSISKAVTWEAGRTSERHFQSRSDHDSCALERSTEICRMGLRAG
jgi:hypothetical protein